MGNALCNLLPCDQEAVLSEFTGSLDNEEEEQIREIFPQYLFFRNEYGEDDSGYGYDDMTKPVRICFCTSCRQAFEGVRGNYARGKMHHEKATCPMCGKTVEALAMYKYRYEMHSLETWMKAAVLRVQPDGALLIEAGNARRTFNWDNLEGTIDWYPSKRYYLDRGTVQMWEERVITWAPTGEKPELKWTTRKTVSEPFAPNVMGYCDYHGEYPLIGFDRIYDSEKFKYCQMEDFFHYEYAADLDQSAPARWTIQFLAQYALHPQIEMAVKLGLSEAVRDLVQFGKENRRLLDWDAANMAAFLRLDKQDSKLFLRAGGSFEELKLWRETCRKLSLKEFWEIADAVGRPNLPALRDCARLAAVDMTRAARYIRSLIPKCARYATHTPGQLIQMWKDYLHMARQLNYDLKEETVVMPRDLQERHDAAANNIRLNASHEEMKRYKTRRRKLEQKYAFTMDGMSILIPVSSAEIVQEGKTLHHCVGGYAARHMEGKTTILFLRKQRTPGRSWLTIELAEERGLVKIRQIHGYRNENVSPRPKEPPIERYRGWLETWLEWVNNGSPRDRDGVPILNTEQKDEEVKTA